MEKESVEAAVLDVLRGITGKDVIALKQETRLVEDLDLDSQGILEFAEALGVRLGIAFSDAEINDRHSFRSVESVVALALTKLSS